MKIYAVIMAGGVGSRFWPRSKEKTPKQLLKIFGENTMIQDTVNRLKGLVDDENIYVITNKIQKQEIVNQLNHIPEENIICEPFGRNTAPCIGLTCLFIKQFNPKANVLVVPSDHIIKDVEEFQRVAKCGLTFTNDNGGIVTLGINPSKPETGYGYIQYDTDNFTDVHIKNGNQGEPEERVFKVKTFAEKPNLETAKAFIESGDFLWNSGMFIFRVDTMLEEIKESLPDLHNALIKLEKSLLKNDFAKVLEAVYSQLKGISIDYGVMEMFIPSEAILTGATLAHGTKYITLNKKIKMVMLSRVLRLLLILKIAL